MITRRQSKHVRMFQIPNITILLGFWIPGVGNWVKIKKFGGINNNNSNNKIRVRIIAKINEHLLCASV